MRNYYSKTRKNTHEWAGWKKKKEKIYVRKSLLIQR